jgi:hypothetical protein
MRIKSRGKRRRTDKKKGEEKRRDERRRKRDYISRAEESSLRKSLPLKGKPWKRRRKGKEEADRYARLKHERIFSQREKHGIPEKKKVYLHLFERSREIIQYFFFLLLLLLPALAALNNCSEIVQTIF